MLKKLVFVAALLGSLSLSALTRADVIVAPEPGPRAPTFVLTLDGMLVYESGIGPRIPEIEIWIGPALRTGGSWFGLDFGNNKALLKKAQNLYGKKVRVTGRLEKRQMGGLIPTTVDVLVVSSLQPLSAEGGVLKRTVRVEMKGRFLFRADGLDILLPDSRLTVDGKTYVVDFGVNHDLWHIATALDGHRAIVSGTLEGDMVHATAIKGDPDYVHEKVTVEVRGELVWNRGLRCLAPEFSLVVGEDGFGLNFASDDLRKLARELRGQIVIVTGTLSENTPSGKLITVTALKVDDTSNMPQTRLAESTAAR
jgi:hypothetical protein